MNNSYYSANDYYKELFGHKVYKISLNAGMTCPNRDGTLGTKGCIFCSEGGSGDFAASPTLSITEQIDEAILRVSRKFTGNQYIAYFQAFTNTYAPISRLRTIFTEAIMDPRICGISIATRPDCLEDDKIALIKELNDIKPVWIELGLQTINEKSVEYIRRGYSNDIFEDTYRKLQAAGIPVIVHVIIGLPNESYEDYMKMTKYLSDIHPHGVKLQLLHILKGTDLTKDYEDGLFKEMTLEEYTKVVVDMVTQLPKDIVIYRITGDGPKKLLIAPLWSANKKNVLNTLSGEFRKRKEQ